MTIKKLPVIEIKLDIQLGTIKYESVFVNSYMHNFTAV